MDTTTELLSTQNRITPVVNSNNRPGLAELKGLPQWLVWRREGDKKPPLDPDTGGYANNEARLLTFDEATALHQSQKYKTTGVGLVLPEGYCAIDLDDTKDDDGYMLDVVFDIYRIFQNQAYCEVSPSGNGLHLVVKGYADFLGLDYEGKPKTKRKYQSFRGLRNLEVFNPSLKGRNYVTWTGDAEGYPEIGLGDIGAGTQALAELKAMLQAEGVELPPPVAITSTAPPAPPTTPSTTTVLSDSEVIAKALASSNGDNIRHLLDGGKLQQHPTLSEAHYAIAAHFGWYASDKAQLLRILKSFNVPHSKWQRKGYLEMTVANIWPTIKTHYNPNYRSNGSSKNGHRIATGGGGGDISPFFSEAVTDAFVKECFDRNEAGDAELFVALYKDKVAYDYTDNEWYVFGPHVWQRLRAGGEKKLLDRVAAIYAALSAKALDAHDAELAKGYLSRAGKLRGKHRAKNVLEWAQSDLAVDGSVWDDSPDLLAVANGVVDLRTGELKQGEPEDYLRTAAPVMWAGVDAEAPRWERFLLEIFDNDKGLVDFMQRLLGYGITGHRRERILPIMWGSGGQNGKDTLLELLSAVLGDMAGAVTQDIVIEQGYRRSAGGATPHILELQHRRLAWVSETKEGERMNAAQVKLVTGGGELTGRALYAKDYVRFKPRHLLLLLTNYRPRANADDNALWLRILLIPFKLTFIDTPTKANERKRQADLVEQMKSEAPGVLAWLVHGAMQWYKDGLQPPTQVTTATDAYRQDEDTVGLFISEACVVAENAQCKASSLYSEYVKWASENHMKAMSGKAFGTRITKRFTKVKKAKGYFYQGIGLLSDA